MEWRAGMETLSPSTINVRLSAVRKMVGEARRNNMIGSEEAATFGKGDMEGIRSFWRLTFVKRSTFLGVALEEPVQQE
jgi:hypothetical protein